MARTNRKDGPAPAAVPASVDALDDLNLDDMFEGGDDSLFDGLDIDLDGMGEITGADDTEQEDAKMSKDLDAMKMTLLGPDGTGDSIPPAPKRRSRKAKRKTVKTLPPLSEEEDVDEEEPPAKKKRRSTKSDGSKKTKKTKFSATSSKMKAKTNSTTSTDVFSKSTHSGENNVVAAAGQFGGRTKKGEVYPSAAITKITTDRPKGKSKVSRPLALPISVPSILSSKTKGRGSSSINITGSRGGKLKQERQTLPTLPKAFDSTYCGLDPGKNIFYPFLPSLPAEPSMKKCHKLYSCLDKIHSAVSNHSSSNKSGLNGRVASENDALFRLLFNDVVNASQHSSSQPSDNAAQILRKATLASSITSSRKVLSQMDKSKLVEELHSVCGLLKRQYDFLNTSMKIMEQWCLDNFSDIDHAAVYGASVTSSSVPVSRKRKLPFDLTSKEGLGSSVPAKNSVVKVKVKCSGFKEPKVSGCLTAHLPLPGNSMASPAVVQSQRVVSNISATVSKSKDGTKSVSEKTKLPSATPQAIVSTPLVAEDEVTPYTKLKPSLRRLRIAEAVARRAQCLETKYVECKEGRQQALVKQQSELHKVVQDDDFLLCNTTALWKWVEKSSYFADYTEDNIEEFMRCAWQPELNKREMFWGEVPTVPMGKREGRTNDVKDSEKKQQTENSGLSIKSLHDRLQSLLVVDGSDDDTEEEVDDDGDEGFVFLDESWRWTKDGMDPTLNSLGRATKLWVDEKDVHTILDVSDLSLEERAYVQLRSVGLVNTPFLPSRMRNVVEEENTACNENKREDNLPFASMASRESSPEAHEGTVNDVIRAMQNDLSRLHRINNSRTALLQSVAKSHLSKIKHSKKKEEENTMLITKYNLLLKKQKESKRSARQNTKKKTDEEWVPW